MMMEEEEPASSAVEGNIRGSCLGILVISIYYKYIINTYSAYHSSPTAALLKEVKTE